MNEGFKNWGGNYAYSAARLHRPETEEQVQEIVARCDSVKVLGSRHSFNGIADTTADLISLERLDRVISLDHERRTVTVEGGILYGPLCEYLNNQGYALHNLASLPHISVSGACATASHGSGSGNAGLAAAVAAMDIVSAIGDVFVLTRQSAEFKGAAVHLGGLGVVTRLTLEIIPAFDIRQDVYENLPLAALEDDFDAIMLSAYSVSLFTDWALPVFNQVWLKRLVTNGTDSSAEQTFFGATPADGPRHPIAGMSPANCTEQMGVPGPW